LIREELHRYLGGILTNLDCQPVIIGGVEDHVHILSMLSRTCEVAEMVKEVKRGSSLWLKTKSPDWHDFAWQNGHGIFSIGYSQVETVRKYIAGHGGRLGKAGDCVNRSSYANFTRLPDSYQTLRKTLKNRVSSKEITSCPGTDASAPEKRDWPLA
jgi:hypothetical protein